MPVYDRGALRPSVVHIGVGSFHRSHQAVYFDDIAQRGISLDWGLVGVGLNRPEMCDALSPQHGLYTVVSRGSTGDDARVIGIIRRYLYAPEDDRAVVRSLADARTRLVTLTITANGYSANQGEAPAIRYLVDALAVRRARGRAPFTVLSCDNLPDNGAFTRAAVLACAERRDPGLAEWLARDGAFPSSMVDRITPQTTSADRDYVERRFGVRDRWPVITEPFSQWVIEDEFSAGRPPLDRVGAQYVTDVRPYALVKTRLLNASHCAIGALGSIAGHRSTDAALADPVFAEYLRRMMADEISPLLPEVPGLDLKAYQESLLERLRSVSIADRLERLRRNGSAKLTVHVLSSILERRQAGCGHPLLTLAVAGWCRSLRGVDERGATLKLDDPMGERLRSLAAGDPRALLAERTVFGDLSDDWAFADEVAAAIAAIGSGGVRATLKATLTEPRLLAA